MHIPMGAIAILSVGAAMVVGSPTLSQSMAQPAVQQGILTAREAFSVINVRVAPTTQSGVSTTGRVGDRVTLLNQRRGADGYLWYYVQFNSLPRQGWVRSDLIAVQDRSVAPVEPLPLPSPEFHDRVPTPSLTTEQIDYFREIALASEFGQAGAIRKWSGDIRIRVNGMPTAADLATIDGVIQDINGLVHGHIRLQRVNHHPNVEMHFAPIASFQTLEPNYVPGNLGFFWTNWQGAGAINSATILIAAGNPIVSATGNPLTQQERSHLIREELTQALGLMQDSWRYRDSIFYQGWTDTTQYTPLDQALITLLYLPQIQAGMSEGEAIAVLRNLTLNPFINPIE